MAGATSAPPESGNHDDKVWAFYHGKFLIPAPRLRQGPETPLTRPARLVNAPVTPLPQRGEGSELQIAHRSGEDGPKFESTLPSPLWGRGAGGEGVLAPSGRPP